MRPCQKPLVLHASYLLFIVVVVIAFFEKKKIKTYVGAENPWSSRNAAANASCATKSGEILRDFNFVRPMSSIFTTFVRRRLISPSNSADAWVRSSSWHSCIVVWVSVWHYCNLSTTSYPFQLLQRWSLSWRCRDFCYDFTSLCVLYLCFEKYGSRSSEGMNIRRTTPSNQ